MAWVKEAFPVGISRACRIIGMSRSQWYYRSRKDDSEVVAKLEELSERFSTQGFPMYYHRIRLEGLKWNHKRVRRVYRKMGLNLRRKKKRRLPERVKEPLAIPETINHTWSMDFMSDSLVGGRKFRCLMLIDDYNRECLHIETDTSLPSVRVIRMLEQTLEWRGKPQRIRVDNGPEFIAKVMKQWCRDKKIKLLFIQPGKPTQNAYVERFNGSFRRDVLDAWMFSSLRQVRQLAEEWRVDYNNFRPHKALGYLPPRVYSGALDRPPNPQAGLFIMDNKQQRNCLI